MIVSRREFVAKAGCFIAASAMPALSQKPSLPHGIGTSRDYTGPLPPSRLGTQRPLRGEGLAAASIIEKAPEGPTPLDIARYFIDVANGVHGAEQVAYT